MGVKQSHFMHLTPNQIKKHCKELKQFMTEFYPHAEMFYAQNSSVPEDALKNLYETMMQETKIIESQYAERKAKIVFPEPLDKQIAEFRQKVKDSQMNIRPDQRRKREQEIRISHAATQELAEEQ